ncbi:unnamed protein product [Paramecium sonneborni]|uniref:Uncharacterized protein n=1 Tax=Paramecium sonneborni TaxID=65129 RepID=A0A8S1PRW8_9CILI|nr:unnamed protein product [Paramecium sonneborni]
MNKSSLGPKLQHQIKINVGHSDELIPEEPLMQFNKQQLQQCKKPRFDTKGRQIIKGKNYSIEFHDCVTVCVYNPCDEVLQIKETLSQLSNVELTKVSFQNPQSFNKQTQYNGIPSKSILKKISQLNAIQLK